MKILITLAALALISGCSALGLTSPKGFDQSLAEAYGVHTAVVQAASSSVASGSLSQDDGKRVYQLAQDSRTVLDAAKTAETAGDQAGAQKELALGLSALNSLQTFLNSKGVK